MSQFDESVKSFKRKQFREFAKNNYEWPASDLENIFDENIKLLKSKRESDYMEKIMHKYPKEFVGKLFDWARGLTEAELNSLKSFEDLAATFIEENPDKVDYDEISQFFDAKTGSLKKFTLSPDDLPLGELGVDENGNLLEKPPAPKIKVAPKIPTINEARRMTSHELEAILKQE